MIKDMEHYTDNLTRSELIKLINQKDEQITKLQSFIVDSDFYGVLCHFLLPVFLDDPNPETAVKSAFFRMYMHELSGLLAALSKSGFHINFTEANKALNKYRNDDGTVNTASIPQQGIRGYKSIAYEEPQDLSTHVRTCLWPVVSYIDFFDDEGNRYALNLDNIIGERVVDSVIDHSKYARHLGLDQVFINSDGERLKRFNDSAIAIHQQNTQMMVETIKNHHDSLINAIENGYSDMITNFLNDHRKY